MMRIAPLLTSASLLAVIPVWQGGDRPNADRPDRDPPSRVGRLSFVTGAVSFRPGDVDDWTAAGSALPVHREQTALVVAGNSPTYDVHDAIRSDDWEDWCASRDRRWDDARSARYVSRGVIGYEDLDDNGDWRETPDYGAVWVPRGVATGWAPYRYGHWAWVEPWGWTWIDDAPWGFAPFHYGRWVYVGGGWAWVPGHVVARPVYAPALVVFVGGRNWSLAIAGGSGSPERVGAARGRRDTAAPHVRHDATGGRAATAPAAARPVRGARAGAARSTRPSAGRCDDRHPTGAHAEHQPWNLRATGSTR